LLSFIAAAALAEIVRLADDLEYGPLIVKLDKVGPEFVC